MQWRLGVCLLFLMLGALPGPAASARVLSAPPQADTCTKGPVAEYIDQLDKLEELRDQWGVFCEPSPTTGGYSEWSLNPVSDLALAPPAPLGDWRLWVVGGASLCAGLLGCRLMLHRTPQSVVYPAHRAMSLVCSLGASAARGETLHWSGWAAVAIGLCVVLYAAAGPAALKLVHRTWAQVRFYILISSSVLVPRDATLQPMLRRAVSS